MASPLPDVPQSWVLYSRETLRDIILALTLISAIVASIKSWSSDEQGQKNHDVAIQNHEVVKSIEKKADAVKATLETKEAKGK